MKNTEQKQLHISVKRKDFKMMNSMITGKGKPITTNYPLPSRTQAGDIYDKYKSAITRYGERDLRDCYKSASRLKWLSYFEISDECYDNDGEHLIITSYNTNMYTCAYIVKLYKPENVAKYGYDIWDDVILVYHTKNHAYQFSIKDNYNENQYGHVTLY